MKNEEFSVVFDGPDLKDHLIDAGELAKSIQALNEIALKSVSCEVGTSVSLKVSSRFRAGSVIIDFVLNYREAIEATENMASIAISGVTIIKQLFRLALWLHGKEPERVEFVNNNTCNVQNNNGEINNFYSPVYQIFKNQRVRSQLDNFTEPLDDDGLNEIRIDDGKDEVIVLNKASRTFFKQGDGTLVSQNDHDVVLEVLCAQFDGTKKGWRFSEGDDRAFTASIEDQNFLDAVNAGKYRFGSGTTIKALMRTTQRKVQRLKVERTILEVYEIND